MILFGLHKKCDFYLKTAFVFLFIFSLFSCAVDEAEISSASLSLLLEYSSGENFPDARLAVFIQTKNSVQRTESFSVENLNSSFIWNVGKPGIFESGGKQYAYSTFLKAPDGENIPKGDYKIVYNDAAGNSSEFTVQMNYDENLLKKKSSEIESSIPEKVENVALYDDMNELIYFGKNKSGWTSNEAILKEYKSAVSKRICYSTPSNSVICFMPEIPLK